MRKTLILAAAAVVVLGAPALAFHDGGVAHCNGCHTMHNSQDGVGLNDGLPVGQGYEHLLLYADATSVCLDCHDGGGSYHVWSDDPLAPGSANRGGGDFVFLEEDNINDGHGGASDPIPGYSAGHTVVTSLKGIDPDPVLSTSPGGSYPAEDLACTSCHDPHGTGSYRILYQEGQAIPGAVFGTGATIMADGISLFGGPETNGNHNAYQSGYSAWCGTCHGDFHAQWGTEYIHPSGQLMNQDTRDRYDAYMGSTDCADFPPTPAQPYCGSGTGANAYLAVVPFEDPAMTTGWTDGPTASSRVACMTCHRAHATSAMDAGRWDFNVTFLHEDGDESGSYKIPNPYDDYSQRSLCNKCHSKDEFDEVLEEPVP